MRLENLKVKNFKTIRSLELKNFTPLTVFIGVNGVGKSNLLDVFNFLFDCFTQGAITAFEQRGGFAAVYTQGGNSPLELEIKYREEKDAPLITYHVTFSASGDRAVVEKEWLQWRPRSRGLPVRFLDFQQGKGWAIPGEKPVLPTEAVEESLVTPHLLAAPLLGTLQKHPRLTALTQYIQSWKITSDMPLDKTSFGLVGIEGIEKGIYPRQLVELAEQYRTLSSSTQFFLTTHSPFFVDGLKPEEVWLLTLDALGYTEANRLSEQPMIQALLKRQLELSSLWGVNYF